MIFFERFLSLSLHQHSLSFRFQNSVQNRCYLNCHGWECDHPFPHNSVFQMRILSWDTRLCVTVHLLVSLMNELFSESSGNLLRIGVIHFLKLSWVCGALKWNELGDVQINGLSTLSQSRRVAAVMSGNRPTLHIQFALKVVLSFWLLTMGKEEIEWVHLSKYLLPNSQNSKVYQPEENFL